MNVLLALALFSTSTADKLIDRGFLYCIPCGEKRAVDEDGDVEKCPKCGNAAYNLREEAHPFAKLNK